MAELIIKSLIGVMVSALFGTLVWGIKKLVTTGISDAVLKGTEPLGVKLDKLEEEMEHNFWIVKKTLQDDVRQTLKEIHDDCIKAGYVSEHMYYTFQQLAQDYTRKDMLDGNSFVQEYWEDMQELNSKSRKLDNKNGKPHN